MPARINYKKGDKLGPHNIEFVKEVTPKIHPSGGKDRRAEFICPYCGEKFQTYIAHIKSGNTKSCGCLHKKQCKINGKKVIRDLTGQRFGRLTVKEDSGLRQGTNIM